LPLFDWLTDPPAARGLRVADANGTGWRYHPYPELARLARCAATRLHAAGVVRDDVVAVARPGGAQFIADFFGALMIGATPAPVAPPTVFRNEPRYRAHVGAILRGMRAAVVTGPAAAVQPLTGADHPCRPVPDRADDVEPWAEPPAPPEIVVVQHSSGSTGRPRPVRIPLRSLEANLAAIGRWLSMTAADRFATWLPMHHDMGLVGQLLLPLDAALDIWQLQPQQFIRSPLRWLRCFGPGGGTMTASPMFGLSHVVHRVRPSDVRDLDLSGWRVVVVGAERIDAELVTSFQRLLAPCGLPPDTISPAYGLAESTLAVTGGVRGEPVRAVEVDPASLVPGGTVRIDGAAASTTTLVSCGRPLDGMTVRVVDPDHRPLGADVLGEIEVSGTSLAPADPDGPAGAAPGGRLRTGDAGFWHGDELYVVGRMGDSVKQLGRWLFAEDAEQAAIAESRRPFHTVALVGSWHGRDTAVVLVEGRTDNGERIGRAVSRRAEGLRVLVLGVPAGSIRRTTSGKPMRRAMWDRLLGDGLEPTTLWDSDPPAHRADRRASEAEEHSAVRPSARPPIRGR
jgi:acyl-CoA synthetase (AMP-forming)/AMP-acid ligase II